MLGKNVIEEEYLICHMIWEQSIQSFLIQADLKDKTILKT